MPSKRQLYHRAAELDPRCAQRLDQRHARHRDHAALLAQRGLVDHGVSDDGQLHRLAVAQSCPLAQILDGARELAHGRLAHELGIE